MAGNTIERRFQLNLALPGGRLVGSLAGLKLGGGVSWPWVWILAPAWAIPAAAVLITAGFVVGAVGWCVVVLVWDAVAGRD